MKSFTVKRYLRLGLVHCLLVLSVAHASDAEGDKGGNGGGGVRIGGKVYVLDLVEAGIQNNPYFNPEVVASPEITSRVKLALEMLPSVPAEIISQKLTEVFRIDQVLALSLLRTMEMYVWRATDLSLIRIRDEDTVINIDPALQVQLAARQNRTIFIDHDEWNGLDVANQTALVIHELVYAMITLEKIQRAYPGVFYIQNSPKARQITAFLFTKELKKGPKRLHEVIGSTYETFPSPLLPVAEAWASSPISIGSNLKGNQISFSPTIIVRDAKWAFELRVMMLDTEESIAEKIRTFCKSTRSDYYTHTSLYYTYLLGFNQYQQSANSGLKESVKHDRNFVEKTQNVAVKFANEKDCASKLTETLKSYDPFFERFRNPLGE